MSGYDQAVMSGPVLYVAGGDPVDATGRHPVAAHGGTGTTTLPNGDPAPCFDGLTGYFEVPDSPDLSPVTTGQLTVSAWLALSVLDFPTAGTADYVYALGKGQSGQHEWAWRVYSHDTPHTSPPRPNRCSTYVWPLSGGLGSGCYVQEPVAPGAWMHLVSVVDLTPTGSYPMGAISWWKDGVLRQTVGLTQYQTVMGDGTAPLRIGTRDLGSFFAGAVGKLAVWGRALDAAEIGGLHAAMGAP